GETVEFHRFAIRAEGASSSYQKIHSLKFDWSGFELNLSNTVSAIGVIAVPIILAILLFFVVLSLYIARKMKNEEVVPGEYTLWSLLFPFRSSRPLLENLASLFLTPLAWIIELFFALLLIAYILIDAYGVMGSSALPLFLVAGVFATAIPVIYAILAWFADFYEREPLRFVVSLLCWGAFTTFACFIINTLLALLIAVVSYLFLGEQAAIVLSTIISALIIAPLVEESMKGLGVLALSFHHEMEGLFDGMLYGFIAGAGFAAVENWFYFASAGAPASSGILGWVFLIGYRSTVNVFAHGMFTATTGGAIGFAKERGWKWAQLAVIPGVLLAMLLHFAFNLSAFVDGAINLAFNVPILVANPLLMFITLPVYLGIAYYGLMLSKRRRESAQKRNA
ncbi:MAG: PrsW family intramembrane metalloprotease, partial [Candidatus Micrarchaeota archaeon]